MDNELRKLKVFFLEDNPDDVEIELYELKKGGFEVIYEVARNRKDFYEKLPTLDADLIIADHGLPDITGLDAIHICKENNVDIPIIFVTGVGDELIAVDSLREGATDYILKKNITGFSARVKRVLDIWAQRKAGEKAEDERQHFHELLLQSQKMESVGRLASGIAHDFNNIITGILGYSEFILKNLPQDSPENEKLQTIISLCKKGNALTKQLLIFGRKTPVEFSDTDVNYFLSETLNLIRHAVSEGVEIKLDLQKGIPEIKADQGQMTQVLLNLILNARDAMGGKGSLKIKTEKLTAMTPGGRFEEHVCISISDTGCGIPEEYISKIFDPFFTTKEVGEGTGLGLAIVYSIINSHSGWIKVYSEPGEGTTFKIYLPSKKQDI